MYLFLYKSLLSNSYILERIIRSRSVPWTSGTAIGNDGISSKTLHRLLIYPHKMIALDHHSPHGVANYGLHHNQIGHHLDQDSTVDLH
jgi:hypothetical protein